MRREYQTAVKRKCEEARAKGHMSGEDVEKAWNELKEGKVSAASRVCRIVRMRGEKRSRRWNEEVREVARKKKLIEATRVVRRAKNEEWVQLATELEKDAWGRPTEILGYSEWKQGSKGQNATDLW